MAGLLGITTTTEAQRKQVVISVNWTSRPLVVGASAGAIVRGEVLARVTATGKLAKFNQDGDDGSENPIGIAYDDLANVAADQTLRVYQAGEYRGSDLTWPDDITAAEKATAILVLEGRGIIVDTAQ